MKVKLLAIALIAVMVGLNACGKKKEASNECKITKFVVNGVEYDVNESTKAISHSYPKTGAGVWTGLPTGKIAPVMEWKGKSIAPDPSESQDFKKDGKVVTYTVTAEDGTVARYDVTVTLGTL